MKHLFLLGVSHHTAPVDVRERVDFSRLGTDRALRSIVEETGSIESVVLSTCNRSEIYITCDEPAEARRRLARFMAEFHGIAGDTLNPHLFDYVDADVVRHLFRVAAGLDSLVVGEPQILGQVKDAFGVAAGQQAAGPLLTKLFHWSFIVGKRVRTETALAEGAVSVSFAAVSLARKIFGDLKTLNVLLLGAGEMGKVTAQHLKSQQVRRVLIASRTGVTAERLAESIGGHVVRWEEIGAALAESDIVVTATGSSSLVLTRSEVEVAMRSRRKPLFIIDIAVPRDVEPAAGQLEQVFLYNIDDLQTIVQENMARRRSEMERAESIVDHELGQFLAWLHSREAIPTVVALRQRFEAIRRAELKRLEPKLASLPPEARARVEEVTRLINEKLLLAPTEQLKSLSDREMVISYSDALSKLFSLGAAEADEEEPLERRGPKRAVGS